MVITKRQLEDKLELFKLAGLTLTGSGWDYAIPQSMFDDLQDMGIENPGQWFMADCTKITTKLHHIGEAYVSIINHRSQANSEIFTEMFSKNYAEGDSEEAIACEKAFYRSFIHDQIAREEVDAGFADLNMLHRFYMEGFNSRDKEIKSLVKESKQFLLQSSWSEKREGERLFCFVIRTKEYACSGTNYVVHMMTDDGGFHHGHYTDDADDALGNFLTRCANKGIKSLPLPLVNETH